MDPAYVFSCTLIVFFRHLKAVLLAVKNCNLCKCALKCHQNRPEYWSFFLHSLKKAFLSFLCEKVFERKKEENVSQKNSIIAGYEAEENDTRKWELLHVNFFSEAKKLANFFRGPKQNASLFPKQESFPLKKSARFRVAPLHENGHVKKRCRQNLLEFLMSC